MSNNYDYPSDPINGLDLTGLYWMKRPLEGVGVGGDGGAWMANMDILVRTMNDITFLRGRYEVVLALMELADARGQNDAWFLQGELGIDHVVHMLFDDYAHFPAPEEVVGFLFYPGDELARVSELAVLFDSVLDDYTFPDLRPMKADKRWPMVREYAASALVAMLRNGNTSDTGQHR